MKRILFISPHPEWGGSATANIMIAKMLIEGGYDVIYNDEYSDFDFYNGVKISHFPFHRNKRKRNTTLISFVKENDINVVFWGLPQLFAFFYPSIRFFNKKKIAQLTIFHSLSLTSGMRGRISELISSLTVRKMDHIIFVSIYTLQSWSKYYFFRNSFDRSKVIYNAITQPSKLHILKNKENLSIGFVGRFSKEKQPELFCSISGFYDGKCIAYGDGPLLQKCKSVYPKVDFRGNVREQDVIYEDIDILVMTSEFENCPMVILEAISRGIPCIVPKVGGIPEIVENGVNGMLYESFSMTGILSAIEEIKVNYNQFRTNCLDRGRHFYCDIIGRDWLSLLNEV